MPLAVLLLVACQRRDGAIDERTPVSLGSNAEWTYATHPSVPLAPDELRDLTRRALEATGRMAAVSPAPGEDSALSAHVLVRLLGADVLSEPTLEPGHAPVVAVHARLRLEFRPPLSDESQTVVVVAGGNARGTASSAARSAVETALGRALEQVVAVVQGRTKSDDELVADLAGADTARAQTALEQLASRRHLAAFVPLVQQLRADDADGALRALGSLVVLEDPRGVRPIIEEAERRDLAFLLQAVYALGSLGGEEAEAYLFTVDSGHPDARVRSAAGEALEIARRRAAIRHTGRPVGEEQHL